MAEEDCGGKTRKGECEFALGGACYMCTFQIHGEQTEPYTQRGSTAFYTACPLERGNADVDDNAH